MRTDQENDWFGRTGGAMSEPIRLDDKDHELIVRCRKAQEKLSYRGSVVPAMWVLFWLWFGGWVLSLLWLGGLLLIRGSESLPNGSGAMLVGGLLWVGLWYMATNMQAFQEDMVRLVCKLADAVEGDRPPNAVRAEPK